MVDPDQRRSLTMALAAGIAALVLVALAVWGASVLLPQLLVWTATVFSPGLGLRTAAIVAAVVSFLALLALTVTAGDGLLGEIQFVIPGFFLFFLFFWLMLAWVF